MSGLDQRRLDYPWPVLATWVWKIKFCEGDMWAPCFGDFSDYRSIRNSAMFVDHSRCVMRIVIVFVTRVTKKERKKVRNKDWKLKSITRQISTWDIYGVVSLIVSLILSLKYEKMKQLNPPMWESAM